MLRHTNRARLLLALTLATAAVVPAAATSAQTATELPDFYDVPTVGAPPGAIIRTEPVSVPGLDGSVQRIMYGSESIRGEAIAVTGIVAVPDTPPPAGGYPVLAWAHGTTGIADACAPSLAAETRSLPLLDELLDQGWLVVATDYEGMGTPGRHPYIVGESEARSVVDSVRAARNLPDLQVSTDYVVWGHSQGGHSAMFALDRAASLAPELDLRGVVAGAPPSQLDLVYDYLAGSPYRYYLLMVGAAINAAYGDEVAPLGEVLNAEGLETVNLVDQGCTAFLAEQTAGVEVADLLVRQADGTFNPFANQVWQPLIAAQDPKNFDGPTDTPLLIIHGGNDEQIPTVSSALLADQLCVKGQELERWMYPGRTHAGVIQASADDMIRWITARFAPARADQPMVPTGQGDIDATVCASGEMAAVGTETVPPPTTPPTTPPTGQTGVGPADPARPVSARPGYTG
jgi:pimeloyl-ACP methyl ester carboxylesterase